MDCTTVSLDSICERIGDGIHGTPSYDENGEYYFFNGSNIVNGSLIADNGTKRVSKEEFIKHKRNLGPNTLLLSINGTIGNVARYKGEKCILGKSAAYLNLKSKVDRNFIYFILRSTNFQEYLKNANGSTIKNVSLEMLRNYEFEMPLGDTPNKIGNILASFDKKIEALESINNNLDQQLKRLFKRLFTDNTSLSLGRLGDVCDVQKGLSYKGEGLTKDGIPMINLGNVVPGGGYRQDKNKTYSGEYKQKNIVKPGDLIIANTDMTYERIILGSPLIVPDYQGDILFTHHLFALRDVKLPKSYLYYYLRTDDFHGLCESSANGTTVLAITKEDVLDAVMPIPPTDLLNQFTSVADPYLAIMSTNDKECKQLEELRNYLLPKLMSGEIDVSTLGMPN